MIEFVIALFVVAVAVAFPAAILYVLVAVLAGTLAWFMGYAKGRDHGK